MEKLYVVRRLSDVEKIPKDQSFQHFKSVLENTFKNSKSKLHSLVNVVYIIKSDAVRPISNESGWSELTKQPRRVRGPLHIQVF